MHTVGESLDSTYDLRTRLTTCIFIFDVLHICLMEKGLFMTLFTKLGLERPFYLLVMVIVDSAISVSISEFGYIVQI